jgi:hypothetical protein
MNDRWLGRNGGNSAVIGKLVPGAAIVEVVSGSLE